MTSVDPQRWPRAAAWRRAVPLGLAAGLALLLGCSPDAGGDAAAGVRNKEVVPVAVAAVSQRDVPVQLRSIGRVEPYSTVSIKAQVDGQLAKVHFQEGQWVHKDDELFTIDPRPFEAALRQEEANLAKDVAEAQNAKVDAERRSHLIAQGFVSAGEYDAAQTRVVSLAATVKADQARVEHARLLLQYCYIRSPIDGRVGQLLVHEGNVVKNNDSTLAVINQVRPIYVTFSLPEQHLPDVRERVAAATLRVDAFVGHRQDDPATGELSFINNTVDTTTGTVLLKGRFANDDEKLWPGQFVDVALTLAVHAGAVVVPSEALQTGQQGQYVFVVTPEMTADPRTVVAGDTVGTDVVITQGLQPGERVVTDGQIRLTAGSAVQIKEPSAAAPTHADAANH